MDLNKLNETLNKEIKEELKSDGLGIFSVIQINFLILKLAGLVNWSWWFVLLPIFISLGISIIGIIFLFILMRDK